MIKVECKLMDRECKYQLGLLTHAFCDDVSLEVVIKYFKHRCASIQELLERDNLRLGAIYCTPFGDTPSSLERLAHSLKS